MIAKSRGKVAKREGLFRGDHVGAELGAAVAKHAGILVAFIERNEATMRLPDERAADTETAIGVAVLPANEAVAVLDEALHFGRAASLCTRARARRNQSRKRLCLSSKSCSGRRSFQDSRYRCALRSCERHTSYSCCLLAAFRLSELSRTMSAKGSKGR